MLRKLLLRARVPSAESGLLSLQWRRGISASAITCAKKMPDRPAPPSEDEFTESFLKGTGPGGQKIVCLCQFYIAYKWD